MDLLLKSKTLFFKNLNIVEKLGIELSFGIQQCGMDPKNTFEKKRAQIEKNYFQNANNDFMKHEKYGLFYLLDNVE